MTVSIRLILCIAAIIVVMMLFLNCQNGSKDKMDDLQSSLMKLKAELESGRPQQIEEPFELRAFDLYIGPAALR